MQMLTCGSLSDDVQDMHTSDLTKEAQVLDHAEYTASTHQLELPGRSYISRVYLAGQI